LDLGGELLDRRQRLLQRRGERRAGLLAERLLEPARGGAERVEVGRRRESRLRLERLLECERGVLRLLDPLGRLRLAQLGEPRAVVVQRHDATELRLGRLVASARTQHARDLFAPLGPTYDRYARLLSFGQDPRWRAFLVSRIPADATRVVDVAAGTAAVSIE